MPRLRELLPELEVGRGQGSIEWSTGGTRKVGVKFPQIYWAWYIRVYVVFNTSLSLVQWGVKR